ncbi:MAG: exosortase/archaeosortase family protein [Gemmataceae bacterium]|nr:exosortase/archaeosortase family protein [Gemmataceae bacterium]
MIDSAAHTHARPRAQARPGFVALVIGLTGLAATSAWAFWPTLTGLVHLWNTDDGYSHGWLVPAFSIWLIWHRRADAPADWSPRPLLGLLVVALALAGRSVAAMRFNEWPEHVAIIPYLLGLALAFGGWPLLRFCGPAILFLVFAVRLPYRIEVSLGAPMQNLATVVSTFVLQTGGLPAIAEGNVIAIRDHRLEVVQACSGLKMLVTFVAFASAVCLAIDKPISDKLVILASAGPIAILVNVIRITATGVMYLYVSSESASHFFHDLAGWIMMPLALALLGIELWVLKHLIVELPQRAAAR